MTLTRRTPLQRTRLARGTIRLARTPIGRRATPRRRPSKATGFSSKVRKLVARRAGDRCERRGCDPDWRGFHLHHRRPRGMGGGAAADTNTAANCLRLCVPCHEWVELHRGESVAAGWLVPQGQDPARVPVVLCVGTGFARVFLVDDGTIREAM